MQDDPRSVLDKCEADLDNNQPPAAVLEALEPYCDSADPALRARALQARGTARNRLGLPSDAMGDLYEAANLLERLDDRAGLTKVYRSIALVNVWRGKGYDATLALLRSIAEGDSQHDRTPLALALLEGGRLQLEIGHPHDARALFRRGLAIGGGDLPLREHQKTFVNLLQALVAIKTPEMMTEARGHAEGAATTLAGAPPRQLLLAQLEIARIHKADQDLAGAWQCIAKAEALAPPNPDAFEHVEIDHIRAELLLAEGKPTETVAILKRVIARYAEDDLASREIAARFMLAQALDAMGHTDEADAVLALALRRALERRLPGHIDNARSKIATRGGDEGAWRSGEAPSGWSSGGTADRFVRRTQLGAGGYGTVVRAYDLEQGTEVALKTSRLDGVYDTVTRRQLSDAARIEIEVTSRIKHPGVARVFGLLSEENDDLVLVEEFIEGPTLRQAMKVRPQRAQALDLLSQIAFGLAAIHAAGVFHRDVKPENILLRGGTAPVIIDFGIATLKSNRQSDRAGTIPYMSPEQKAGGRLDGRADLYSLGRLACELLIGELPEPQSGFGPPFIASFFAIGATRRALLAKGLPQDLSDFLARMMAPHRSWRPKSAALVGRTFARAARDTTTRPS